MFYVCQTIWPHPRKTRIRICLHFTKANIILKLSKIYTKNFVNFNHDHNEKTSRPIKPQPNLNILYTMEHSVVSSQIRVTSLLLFTNFAHIEKFRDKIYLASFRQELTILETTLLGNEQDAYSTSHRLLLFPLFNYLSACIKRKVHRNSWGDDTRRNHLNNPVLKYVLVIWQF